MAFYMEETEYNSDEYDDGYDHDEFDMDHNFWSSNHDVYRKDDPIPAIVKAARDGDLNTIKTLIANKVDLDERQRWTEVVGKYGYDKSWEWFNNSALIEASWRGHIEIVRQLLLAGADPMLKSCYTDDEYHTAIGAANSSRFKNDTNKIVFPKIIEMLYAVHELWTESNPECNESAHYEKNRKEKNKPSIKDIKAAIDNVSSQKGNQRKPK